MKILAIDDDKTIRLMLRRYFSQKHGITILEASDGLEGLQIIEEEFPDLIISDVSMPVMDGIECLEILRSDPVYGKIPVLMLTATQEKEQVQRLVGLGISGFIAKPIDIKELNVRISKCMESIEKLRATEPSATVKTNPFALRVLIVDGNERFRSFFNSLFGGRYTVLQANSGMQALLIVQHQQLDIICIGDGLSLITEERLVQKIRLFDPQKQRVILSCAEWMPSIDQGAKYFEGWIKKSTLPDCFVPEVERCLIEKHLQSNRLELAARNFIVPRFMLLLKQVIDVEEEHIVEDFVVESQGLDLFGTAELYDPMTQSKIQVGIQGAEKKLLRMIARLKEEDQNVQKTRREIIEDLVKAQAEKVGFAFQEIGIKTGRHPVHLVALPAGSPPVSWSIGYAVKTKTDEKYIAGFIFPSAAATRPS